MIEATTHEAKIDVQIRFLDAAISNTQSVIQSLENRAPMAMLLQGLMIGGLVTLLPHIEPVARMHSHSLHLTIVALATAVGVCFVVSVFAFIETLLPPTGDTPGVPAKGFLHRVWSWREESLKTLRNYWTLRSTNQIATLELNIPVNADPRLFFLTGKSAWWRSKLFAFETLTFSDTITDRKIEPRAKDVHNDETETERETSGGTSAKVTDGEKIGKNASADANANDANDLRARYLADDSDEAAQLFPLLDPPRLPDFELLDRRYGNMDSKQVRRTLTAELLSLSCYRIHKTHWTRVGFRWLRLEILAAAALVGVIGFAYAQPWL